jgi:hypothetical protein
MRAFRRLVVLLSLTGASWTQCPGTFNTSGVLHWSEAAQIASPNRAWVVEVHPVFDAEDNRSPVTIRSCRDSKSWHLFTLQRRAEVYWRPNSGQVLIVDQPLSGTNKLLLFSVASLAAGAQRPEPDAIDEVVNSALVRKIEKNRHIQFYLPTFVQWKGGSILLAVGGVTHGEGNGPFEAYCYGMEVNGNTLRVESVMSEKELRAGTGHSCQVSP